MPERIPWETRADLGLVRAFLGTLALSVQSPNRFYVLAPRDASPWPAIAYGLVFEMAVALPTFAYDRTFGAEELGSVLATIAPQIESARPGATALLEKLHDASSIGSLVLAPASYLLELGFTASVTWVGLRLMRDLRTSFGTLVRLFAYASWVRLFGLLGVSSDLVLSSLGSLASFAFAAYTWLVVVKRSQGVSTERAVYASLVGGLVAAVVGAIVLIPPSLALIVWALGRMPAPALGR